MDLKEVGETTNDNDNVNNLLQKQQPHITQIVEHSNAADLETMKSYRSDAIRLEAEAKLSALHYGDCLTYIDYTMSTKEATESPLKMLIKAIIAAIIGRIHNG